MNNPEAGPGLSPFVIPEFAKRRHLNLIIDSHIVMPMAPQKNCGNGRIGCLDAPKECPWYKHREILSIKTDQRMPASFACQAPAL